MSNNEGNSWPPRDNATPDGHEGFASPSDLPSSAFDPTKQQPRVEGGHADEPTGQHGSQHRAFGPMTDDEPDYWTPPADDYAKASDGNAREATPGSTTTGNSKFGWLRWLAVAAVSALIGALVATWAGDGSVTGTPTRSDTAVATPSEASSSEATPSNIRGVLDKVQRAVVTIDTDTAAGEGSGTGMIVSSDGEILTNNHVVAGAQVIRVTLDGETESRTARLLGTDSTIDSALIKIDGVSNLPTVEFGDSAAVQVGDEVVAIGNALALTGGPSVTSGIVSAKDRSITDASSSLSNLIQTDTAINPGNSGGPLANMAGQVIGMNTAVIRGQEGQFENIGFAIAIDTVQPAIADLRSGVQNQPAYLGLSPVTLDESIKERFDLTPDEGAVISQIQQGSPADEAGLARFDVITEIDGTKITTSDQLVTLVRGKKPGEDIEVVFYRGAERQEVTATLAARPE